MRTKWNHIIDKGIFVVVMMDVVWNNKKLDIIDKWYFPRKKLHVTTHRNLAEIVTWAEWLSSNLMQIR